MRKKTVRLSTNITPIKYQITLKPDLEAFVFEGEEVIDIKLKKSVQSVTLHSVELDIKSAEFIHQNKEIWAGKVSYNEKTETATLTFNKKFPAGKGKLKLVFRGIINDKMVGFYRSSYKNHQGKVKHLATTQFEATDARRAFPCFDEPTQKAIFKISLIIPKHLTAISNTLPVKIREHSEGFHAVQFFPTPKMSTYLLAMIIGELEYVQSKSKQGVQVRVFTTPGKKQQGRFALKTAIKMLEFYNSYFGISYPLNTLDLIAIPDFSHGAMENWGAITYRETALLIDEEHSSAQSKQHVALVIAHELAHQWFGNLVTMEWWTHLWLNEGFASFIEYLAVDHVFPKWDIWTQFAYYDQGVALELDGFKSTHPIEIDVHHPKEIGEIFDAISYSKGASVIKMLHNYLGDTNFRKGLQHYLQTHAYKNAATEHLWQALEKVSGKPISKIMKNWTKREGYPLIQAKSKKQKAKNGNTITIKISQGRFYISPVSKQQSKDKTVWQVPIKIQYNNITIKQLSIVLDKKSTTINVPKNSEWIKVNTNETGFYRTDYSQDLMGKLTLAVQKLQPLDRLGIIRDAFALNFAGKYTISEVLKLLKNYKSETDYTVWVKVVSGLDDITQLVAEETFFPEFEKFNRILYSKILKNLGWHAKRKEAHTHTLLRSLMLRQLGSNGDKKTLIKAKELFKKHTAGKKKIHPDIRGAVYNIVAENGSAKEYKQLTKLFDKTEMQEEQKRIMSALTQFKQRQLIQKALKFALSKKVRPQDSPLMLSAIAANPYARSGAWKFLKANWKILKHRYAAGGHMLNRIIQPFWHFSSQSKAKEIKNFFKKNAVLGTGRTISQVLEKIEANRLWKKNNFKNFKNYIIKT